MSFNKSKNNYLETVTVSIGTWLGEEKDEDVQLILREPKTEWVVKFSKVQNDDEAALLEFKNLLPNVIVSHNFTEDGVKPLNNEEVTEIIFDKMGLSAEVSQQYFGAAFFTRQKKTGSR